MSAEQLLGLAHVPQAPTTASRSATFTVPSGEPAGAMSAVHADGHVPVTVSVAAALVTFPQAWPIRQV